MSRPGTLLVPRGGPLGVSGDSAGASGGALVPTPGGGKEIPPFYIYNSRSTASAAATGINNILLSGHGGVLFDAFLFSTKVMYVYPNKLYKWFRKWFRTLSEAVVPHPL